MIRAGGVRWRAILTGVPRLAPAHRAGAPGRAVVSAGALRRPVTVLVTVMVLVVPFASRENAAAHGGTRPRPHPRRSAPAARTGSSPRNHTPRNRCGRWHLQQSPSTAPAGQWRTSFLLAACSACLGFWRREGLPAELDVRHTNSCDPPRGIGFPNCDRCHGG